jgi:hypothetical protein
MNKDSDMTDIRNIRTGRAIPTETYSDQPYIVNTADGAWLCVVTTGVGREGQSGQHVVTVRSSDEGRTWSAPVDVEPADGPEASYAVLLAVPEGYPNAGRIYCFYNHNTDNVREAIADLDAYPDGVCRRVDSLGHFCFKVSDDGGRSWSAQRYDVPQRDFEIDRQNAYGGTLKFFWNVGKPLIRAGLAYVPLHKVGGFGQGFFTRSEGVFLVSANLLTEPDPSQVTWQTLPDGEVGLRTPPGGGPIAEEQSTVVLSDGSLYCVYRTIDGHPAFSYSRDGGHTWSEPRYKRYADGRLIKHPRAANFCWRCENGKYLYWFHNHGGRFIREHPHRRSMAYEDRNPVWLCGGIEIDTHEGKVIRWSQPEIVLHDDDPYIRMSYPDLVEQNGRIYLTETQKDVARVHEVDLALLSGLWGQFENQIISTEGLVLSLPAENEMPAQVSMPALPSFLARDPTRADHGTQDLRQGFSLDLWLRLSTLDPGQILVDNRTPSGKGFCLQSAAQGAIEIVLCDGRTENRWASDPGLLEINTVHHVVVVVDGGPKIVTYVVDGQLNDGGAARQFGWGRFSPHLRDINGADTLRISPCAKCLRLYDRALRTSEAIGSFRAGPSSPS